MLLIVGAGLPRTGTHSLKLALERLTGGRCYHMREVSETPGAVDIWQRVADGTPPDWDAVLDGYVACVDWPASAFWRELAAAQPDAPVLLSQRASAEEWLQSVEKTVAIALRQTPADPVVARVREVSRTLARSFCPEWPDPVAMRAAYERHNAAVRDAIDPGRLVEWQPTDGWEPICTALEVAVPDEPFPRTNAASEFRVITNLDGS